jgi:hypothetical protein
MVAKKAAKKKERFTVRYKHEPNTMPKRDKSYEWTSYIKDHETGKEYPYPKKVGKAALIHKLKTTGYI